MDNLTHQHSSSSTAKDTTQVEEDSTQSTRGTNDAGHGPSSSAQHGGEGDIQERRGHQHHATHGHTHYRVYKRRWFGLLQLVLLNIVVSWDWLTFAPVSTTAAEYFDVSESAINWLSTGFMFAFSVICPVTIWALNRSPKESIIWASVLLLLGNWVRYAGTRASGGIYGLVFFGQVLTGLAQPFVLAAPTRYSDLWFTESGRVSATALASLANPFGGALAQLVNPFLGSIPDIVLYVSIIATVATIPSFFLPAAPPTPPSASSALSKNSLRASIKHIFRCPSFYVVCITFGVYVGLFNAFSSLLNQIMYPYGFSEDEAGICGAVLILVGLVTAAITSPILDRTHAYLLGIKILVPLVALSYLAMIWAPQTRGIPAPYVISALLGAASFSLLPVALEYLVEITYPASPEVGSTICWASGQLLGGTFIVIMDALKDGRPVDLEEVRKAGRNQGGGNMPPGNMYNSLVFQATIALAIMPLALALGVKRLGLGDGKVAGRLKVDEAGEENEGVIEGQEA